MTFRTLIQRSLRFHWRSHLGVVLGAAIGSAALIGALVVGDSVRGSLREQALARIGNIHLALNAGDRLVRSALALELQEDLRDRNSQPVPVASVLVTSASAATTTGAARVNQVQVLGVAEDFWGLAGAAAAALPVPPNTVGLNQALAAALNLAVGDTIILRLPKPTALNQEIAVSQKSDASVALRLTVHTVVNDAALGNFNLRASPFAPFNAFVSRRELQSRLGVTGQANLILVGGNRPKAEADRYPSFLEVNAATGLADNWRLADAQGSWRAATNGTFLELRTPRVFLDPPVIRAAQAASPNPQPVLTFLANLFQVGTNVTPYSMVTAAGAPWTPSDLQDDEIVVSQWLADDLRVQPGDDIALSYFRPESGAKLEEATNTFRVHSIAPPELPWADRTLMPDFPGIEKAESTSEWDAGFPLTYEIRKKDDDYWKLYRGTPKAFITLATGQKMWGNRFGDLTAIRFPIPTNEIGSTLALTPAFSPGEREKRSPSSEQASADISTNSSQVISGRESLSPLPGGEGGRQTQINPSAPPHVVAYKEALEKKILAHLKPEELGLRFEPVREQALKAAAQSQDFGGLFLGFSFFLIIAALLLMAMLFQFGLEQRAPEIGTLLALGFTPKQVRKLLLREGVALAFIGGVAGAVGGVYFAKAMLHGLTTIWRDAVGATALQFHVTGQTLIIGLFASVVVSTITIWLALRKFVKRPPRELLVGEIQAEESKASSLKSKMIAVAATGLALGLVGWTLVTGDTANAGAFFGAGALVLIAGLSFVSAWLARFGGASGSDPARTKENLKPAGPEAGAPFTMASLAVRGCARRRKRSLATVAMLACGSFLIVSIGVFRLDANRDATQKNSGTGGFALIGETTLPVVQDLNSASGRDFFALNERDLVGVNFVPFRVRAGDEASCLNLNRAQQPRLLGVGSSLLGGRFTFAKMADGSMVDKPWQTLERGAFYPKYDQPLAEDEVAAIGDANSIQWAMGKKIGDTIDYVDDRGQSFKVRIVGAVANSILQGQLLIDEAEFVKRFPGESGYRMFLIDAPSNREAHVSATLSRALQDVGLELTPTETRLNQFNAVQNTYLGTFQVLGGLGLLLGSVGLGIVVLRNVLERRSELAVLLAVGFRRQQVQRLVLLENGVLLLLGLGLGVAAAGIAVLPALLSPAAQLPGWALALTLAAVLLNGAMWTWMATRYAVRGDLLAALRND
jgi:ABC-type antimicrobial peptide transport system permease subunit